VPELSTTVEPYAIQYSETGRLSRKELPPDALAVLLDVLDALALDPKAFSGRTRPINDSCITNVLHEAKRKGAMAQKGTQ
jgi:hypothetical protein